jgi:hypothetical protein
VSKTDKDDSYSTVDASARITISKKHSRAKEDAACIMVDKSYDMPVVLGAPTQE